MNIEQSLKELNAKFPVGSFFGSPKYVIGIKSELYLRSDFIEVQALMSNVEANSLNTILVRIEDEGDLSDALSMSFYRSKEELLEAHPENPEAILLASGVPE